MVTLQVKTEIHTIHSAKSLLVEQMNRAGPLRESTESAPARDTWIHGDRQTVWEQIRAFMGTTELVRQRDGRLVEKKRRRDAKCLVVGTLSCPRANPRRNTGCRHATPDCQRCCASNADQLKRIVGTDIALSLSLDTDFPRLRFYAAGNPKSILSVLSGLKSPAPLEAC